VQIINWLRQSWWILLAAGFFLYEIINGVKTGNVALIYRRVKRSDDPLLYWVAMILVGLAFVVAILILAF
jgi:hypothetical protein